MKTNCSESTSIRFGHPLTSLRPSSQNGPGWRINLWLQGCSLLCTKKCLNPHFLDPEGGFVYSICKVEEVIKTIVDTSPYEIEGITVLGGEPTDQLPNLIDILKIGHGLNLSTMVYTGYTLKALYKKYPNNIEQFLKHVDILVDGPFIASRYDPKLGWRGSTNQKIHCPTGFYKLSQLSQEYQNMQKGFSIKMGNGMISISGLQDGKNMGVIEESLYSGK